LGRIREQLEYENRRLREEVKYLEDNARRRPNSSGRPESADAQQVSAVMLLRKECEGLKVENRGLKERIQQLNMELDAAVQQAVNAQKRPSSASATPNGTGNAVRALEQEIGLLRDKERDYLRQLQEKEAQIQRQKNEWAEIYGGMKQEIEGLRQENRQLA
jgi:chromosome segregation ATPase